MPFFEVYCLPFALLQLKDKFPVVIVEKLIDYVQEHGP